MGGRRADSVNPVITLPLAVFALLLASAAAGRGTHARGRDARQAASADPTPTRAPFAATPDPAGDHGWRAPSPRVVERPRARPGDAPPPPRTPTARPRAAAPRGEP